MQVNQHTRVTPYLPHFLICGPSIASHSKQHGRSLSRIARQCIQGSEMPTPRHMMIHDGCFHYSSPSAQSLGAMQGRAWEDLFQSFRSGISGMCAFSCGAGCANLSLPLTAVCGWSLWSFVVPLGARKPHATTTSLQHHNVGIFAQILLLSVRRVWPDPSHELAKLIRSAAQAVQDMPRYMGKGEHEKGFGHSHLIFSRSGAADPPTEIRCRGLDECLS